MSKSVKWGITLIICGLAEIFMATYWVIPKLRIAGFVTFGIALLILTAGSKSQSNVLEQSEDAKSEILNNDSADMQNNVANKMSGYEENTIDE